MSPNPSPAALGFEVREAQEDEFAAVGQLVGDAYALPEYGLPAPYLEELRDVGRRVGPTVVLVAVAPGGEVAGSITYVAGGSSYDEEMHADEGGLRMLAVTPAWRRRGVGTALVLAGIERARAEGRKRVVLHTMAAMTEAQRMYERIGFVRDAARNWTAPSGNCAYGYRLDLDQ